MVIVVLPLSSVAVYVTVYVPFVEVFTEPVIFTSSPPSDLAPGSE